MQKLSNKILALVIVLIMLAINIIPSTVQAAEEIQNASTKEPNVEFDAKVNGAYEVQAQIGDEIELEFDLKVFKEGSIKNALVSIENNNYSLIESSMENFNGLTADGELKLQDITGEDQKVAKVKAKFNKGETNKKSDFNKESKITFSAVYTNELGKEKRIEKIIKLKVDWQVKDVETELYQELIRYIKYDNKTMITYRINEQVKNDKIPVKKNYLQTIIPQINKSKPSQISVIGDYDEYKEEDGVLVITKDYSKLTEEQIKNKEESEYDWKTEESYIVTYIYDAQEDINTITATSKMDIETILDEKLENSVTIQNDVTTEVGKLIELDLEGTPKLSKGYMYTNLVRVNKLKTEFNTAYKINVSTKDVVDSVVLKEMEYKFNDVRTEIINTKVSTHKEELEKVLGENGEIIVTDAEGNEIGRLNKDKESIDINAHEIYFETSKPEAEGILTINVDKKIDDDLGYTREDINAIKTLSTKTILEGYLGENVISSKEFETKVEMEEPVSSADIAMEPRVLSTMVENQEVEIDVRLNNAKAQDALFTDPIIQIELPEQVKNIDIKSADIIYEKELVPAEIKVEGNVIRATLTGTQTQYNDDGIINGSIIRINTNMTLDNLATSSDEKVVLRYGNSATKEEGVRELDADVEAPTDFITLNGMQIENAEIIAMNEMKEVEINPGVAYRKARISGKVINNLRRNADGFAIIGKIPTEGMTKLSGEEVGTNLNAAIASVVEVNNINAKVYYSDNVNEYVDGNWNEQPTINSKAFKIVPEEDVPQAKEIIFSYDIRLPDSVESSKEMYSLYGVVYSNNAVEGTPYSYVDAQLVGAYTPGENDLQITYETIDTFSKNVITDDSYAGQYVTYNVSIKNNSRNTISNISIDATLNDEAEFIDFEEAEEGSGIYNNIYVDRKNLIQIGKDTVYSNKSYAVDSIEAGETKIININTRNTGFAQGELDTQTGEFKNPKLDTKTVVLSTTVKYGSRTKSNETRLNKKYVDASVELTSNSTRVIAEDSVLRVNLKVYNPNTFSVKNIETLLNVPEDFEVTAIRAGNNNYTDVADINRFFKDSSKAQLKFNVNDLEDRGSSDLESRVYATAEIEFKVKKLNQLRKEEIVNALITFGDEDNSKNTINSNTLKFLAENKAIVDAHQTVNVDGTIKDDINLVRFETTIENASENRKTITFENQLINGLDIYEADLLVDNTARNIEIGSSIKTTFTMEANSTAVVRISSKPIIQDEGTIININNKPTITSVSGEVDVNNVQFSIEGTGKSSDIDPTDPSGEPFEPKTDEKYSISGTVWLDENNNGLRDSSERRSEGNLVRLYHDNQIIKETNTDVRGEYTFSDLEADGKGYYVLVDFDTENYRVSPKLDTQNTSINNDFTEQSLDGKKIASSMKISLTRYDVKNIDLALTPKNTFDFELNKYVTSVKIMNPEYNAREYKYVNTKFAKVEIPARNIENTTIMVEYLIKISNIGKEAGFVKTVSDYMPASMQFETEMNDSWFLSQDGN